MIAFIPQQTLSQSIKNLTTYAQQYPALKEESLSALTQLHDYTQDILNSQTKQPLVTQFESLDVSVHYTHILGIIHKLHLNPHTKSELSLPDIATALHAAIHKSDKPASWISTWFLFARRDNQATENSGLLEKLTNYGSTPQHTKSA